MRAFTIIQPWTTLLVRGIKRYETRSWAAPASVIGERIALCASKKNQMRKLEPALAAVIAKHGLVERQFPFSAVVGVATLAASIPMTQAFIDGLSDHERAMGHFEVGRWAWEFKDPEPLAICPPISGRLGFFNWEESK